MPKVSDMTDEQIAGFFYLALWNNEIAKVLESYPNAVPVERQTGPIGFYLWTALDRK